MVRLRLTRVGAKKNPIWRIVATDQRSPRDGRFIEIVGRYNPQTEPSTIEVDAERAQQYWLDRGAQPTNRSRSSCACRASRPNTPMSDAAAARAMLETVVRPLVGNPDAIEISRSAAATRARSCSSSRSTLATTAA